MPIYFILADKRFVKIGVTRNVKNRLKNMRTYNHTELELLVVIEGDRDAEKALHLKFHHERTRGEWFNFSAELRKYIRSLDGIKGSYETKRNGSQDKNDCADARRVDISAVMSAKNISIAKDIRKNLIAIARAYRAATGQSWTQMSKEFYGNSDFFQKLIAGTRRSVSSGSLEKMILRFRKNWPPGADWPFTKAIFMTLEPM
jgi:hypothetical protein